MFEKIKTYTTKRVSDILSKDAENFGFLKSDGITPNKNALLSALLINYFDIYNQQKQKREQDIFNALKSNTYLPEEKIKDVVPHILNIITMDNFEDKSEKYDQLVSLKPTKQTNAIIEYINSYLLQSTSLSKYLRDLFTSYTSLPQDRREIIIFKPLYDALMQAISNNKKVFITPKYGQSIEVSPFAISLTKEEMHLYLLAHTPNSCKTIKLSSLDNVVILDKPANIPDDAIKILTKMSQNNPQFIFTPNTQPIIIEFTDKGLNMFRKIYVHRPLPCKIDGNTFTFDCSYTQAIYYFTKFGKDAIIISPDYVKTVISKFYETALNVYKKN